MALMAFCLRSSIATRNSLLLRNRYISGALLYSDDSSKKDSLYEILGIPSTSTQTEIKKAYYDQTLKYHPDRNENSDIAATKFKEVAEAYEILGNYALRKRYDKGMPLPLVKKAAKRAVVPHKVKYQTFYDSRAVPPTSNVHYEETEEESEHPSNKYVREAIERARKDEATSGPIKAVTIIYFAVVWFIYLPH